MDRRVRFDFEIDFTNGGGIQGQDFRLDIAGDDISDRELADYIVRDMRLLMVGAVRILNRQILVEKHKRGPIDRPAEGGRLVDLSQVITDGLVTYRGLPAPKICDFLSRERSRDIYEPGTEFQIGRIDMVANTGTYLDTPFHRYPDGRDLAQIGLESLCDLDAIVVRFDHRQGRAIDVSRFRNLELRGRAVLVHTGWDVHWNTDRYQHDQPHPFLTAEAGQYLRDCGVRLVGIDSVNIDDANGRARPVHTILLGADVPIVEHLCNLGEVPDEGFRFSAMPPKFSGVGTFPVRAVARLP